MNSPTPEDVVVKLRRKVQRFPAMGGGSIGTDAYGKTTSTSYVTDDGYRLANPDGPEAADLISRLTTALRQVDAALSCGREGAAHYCPNCDNSLDDAREIARTALSISSQGEGDRG